MWCLHGALRRPAARGAARLLGPRDAGGLLLVGREGRELRGGVPRRIHGVDLALVENQRSFQKTPYLEE